MFNHPLVIEKREKMYQVWDCMTVSRRGFMRSNLGFMPSCRQHQVSWLSRVSRENRGLSFQSQERTLPVSRGSVWFDDDAKLQGRGPSVSHRPGWGGWTLV